MTFVTKIKLALLVSILFNCCDGYILAPTTTTIPFGGVSIRTNNNNNNNRRRYQPYGLGANVVAVELEPEPDGGIVMVPRNSLGGCRVKKLDEVSNIVSDDGTVYKFWMTAEAESALIKEIRTQILKDASKKANFPGFRKGQVPPYAQPQITEFSVREAIIKTCQAVVDAYGLKSLAGSDGDVTFHEDVSAIAKKYKIGDSIQFTATLNAALANPVTVQPEAVVVEEQIQSAVDTVIDVTPTSTTEEVEVDAEVETEKEIV